MATHTSLTQRLDAPTIAFDRQPTVSVAAQALARDLFERSTSSTLRPVVGPSSCDLPTVATGRVRKTSASVAWLCLVCLFLGLGVGHLVREGRGYVDAVTASLSDGRAHRARQPRTSEGTAAQMVKVLRAKETPVAAVTTVVATRPARGRAKPASAASHAVTNVDALFVDFEPSFRAPR